MILPADNVKDLEEIDQTVRSALHFVPVEQVDGVLAQALDMELAREDLPGQPLDAAPDSPVVAWKQ